MKNPRLLTAFAVASLALAAALATTVVVRANEGPDRCQGPGRPSRPRSPPCPLSRPSSPRRRTSRRRSSAKLRPASSSNLEVREFVGQLADGVEYTFWTYGGSRPRFVHPRPRGRCGRVPSEQSPVLKAAAQHRSARRHRSRRRRGLDLHGPRAQLAVHLQGAQSRPLRLSLRHRPRARCTSATACMA